MKERWWVGASRGMHLPTIVCHTLTFGCRRRTLATLSEEDGPMPTDWAGLLKPRERHSTPSRRPFPLPPRLQEQLEHGKAAIAEPMVGITADGTPEPGLFAIQ